MGLSQKAELVHLTVYRYKGCAIDREVDATINATYETKRQAGQFRKWAIDRDSLKPTQRAHYNLTSHYMAHTLPWDAHHRLLPVSIHFKYMEAFGKLEAEFLDAVTDFCIAYPSIVHRAESDLGPRMFKSDDYPTITAIKDKFRVFHEIAPVPESGDFRLDLGDAEVKRIQTEMEHNMKLRLASAMSNAWQRLYGVIEDMVKRMEDSKKPRDTIITNISELCGILPHLNLGEDKDLDKMRREVEKRLCSLDPKAIRKDPKIRKEATETAQDIMEKMKEYM
jgi:hypothetical protein